MEQDCHHEEKPTSSSQGKKLNNNNNHNNEFDTILPISEGLLRFRDDSQLHKEIITFPQESLHSFRFSQNATKIYRKGWNTSSQHYAITPKGDQQQQQRRKPKTVGYPIQHTKSRLDENNSKNHKKVEEDHHTLHHTTRFLQQNQAILTTYEDWRIILTNTIAQEILNGDQEDDTLIGKSILDLVNPTYRERLKSIIQNRRDELNHDPENIQEGMVLVCGNVLPIIKLDGAKSTASLWLKEKRNEAGSSVFIWIFEQVNENLTYISINQQGSICHVDNTATTLFDYPKDQLLGKPIQTIIPGIGALSDINKLRFFGCQTKKEARFPVIAKLLDDQMIQVISMPVLEGLVTVNADTGIIEGCNDAFVNYLFGYLQTDLVAKVKMETLLPQYPRLLTNLRRDQLLQEGLIINNVICRKLVTDQHDFGQLYAIHRDGSSFEIQIQLKWVEAENECALWISFDRDTAFKRHGHIPIQNKAPPPPPKPLGDIQYSAQTNANTIDDYVILDSLGQGAYGLVKLAVKKDDPAQKKVVIKFVIKSRILVDCWTRDRKLGTIPVEIHILHTLKKNPHVNLVEMLDYFEDNDYYYIVMSMYGSGLDLFDYIELKETMEEEEIRAIFKQVVVGVKHLHDNKIIHRDIKDENVVLDNFGGLRLIDFGSAAYLKHNRKYETFVGTLDYAAPEILRGHTYSGKPQDVWALGILLFTLIYRENPFYDIDEIMSRELRLPFILSTGSVDLIHQMLERDVEKRIDIHQVLSHPWLDS